MIHIPEEGKSKSLLALTILAIIFIYMVWEIFKVKYGALWALGLPFVMMCFILMRSYGDMIPLPRGKQVNLEDGTSATLKGQLIPISGGKKLAKISVEKALVPEDVIEQNRVGGWYYLYDWISIGGITIWISGEDWQWEDIPSHKCSNPHGAIRFKGNLRGKPLYSDEEAPVYKELQRLTKITRYAITSMEEIEAQAANMAAKQYLDQDMATQHAKVVSDRMKNVRIMAKGGRDVDALGQEMAGGA